MGKRLISSVPVICALSIGLSSACDTETNMQEAPSEHGGEAENSTSNIQEQVQGNLAAYRLLAAKTTADEDEIRRQLKKFPAFRGATFPSMVDIKSPATGETFAYEVKVLRDGQDAGFAWVALKDGELRLHSYGKHGRTVAESVLSDLKGSMLQDIGIYQQGMFGLVALDLTSESVLAASSREVPSDEQWSMYVQAERSRGYSPEQQVETWGSVNGSSTVDSGDHSRGERALLEKRQVRAPERDEHVVGNRDTPLWSQYETEYDKKKCSVGCGPIAYAMYLAWAEKEWSEVNVFDGDSYNPAPAENNDAGDITKAIGDQLGTFCVLDTKSAFTPYYPETQEFRKNVNTMLSDLNRGSGLVKGRFDFKLEPDRIRDYLTHELSADSEGGKDRPVIIFGWPPDHDEKAGIIETIKKQHIYLLDGVAKENRSSQRSGSSETTAYRINLGWSQKSNPRRWAAAKPVEYFTLGIGRIRRPND